MKSTKKFKAGQTHRQIRVIPQGDLGGASKKNVKVVIEPGTGYTVGSDAAAKVKIVR